LEIRVCLLAVLIGDERGGRHGGFLPAMEVFARPSLRQESLRPEERENPERQRYGKVSSREVEDEH